MSAAATSGVVVHPRISLRSCGLLADRFYTRLWVGAAMVQERSGRLRRGTHSGFQASCCAGSAPYRFGPLVPGRMPSSTMPHSAGGRLAKIRIEPVAKSPLRPVLGSSKKYDAEAATEQGEGEQPENQQPPAVLVAVVQSLAAHGQYRPQA